MRLVCPNCGAQYEVDDRVMPENGRDVQCSNCGHAWFQLPPSAEAKEIDTTSPFDDVEDTDGDETEVQETEDVQEPSAPDVVDEPDESDTDDERSKPSEKSARKLDESVRNILQEEAAQELQARAAERENIETQTDLGLDDAPKAKPGLHAVESDPQIEEASFEADDLKGRDVLPDIEEINSTLDAPEGEGEISIADDDAVAAAKSGGFRRGFVLVVVLACLLAILYIFAPAIGERFPALQPVLEKYIVVADQVRVALEDTMRNAISKMQGLIDKPENG